MKYQVEDIKREIESVYAEVTEIHRHLHMHPELSQQEVNTSKLIQSVLDKVGVRYEKDVAGHGVVATVEGKNQDYGVGIRADIDALPIVEKTDVPYKSQNEGVMHACGHDIHTSILLGTAMVLNKIKEDLPGCVRLIFQPAEETIGGAKPLIDAGALENPKIGKVIGLHVDPLLDVGKICMFPGVMNAASCEFFVTVKGESCHGARPTDGVDPLLPSCAMVLALQSIVTRKIAPVDAALITVGSFISGQKNNVIPGETKFSGIIRTLKLEHRDFIKKEIERICVSTAQAYGAECEVTFRDSYPTLENDFELFQVVRTAAEESLGEKNVEICDTPNLTTDDFAYFCHAAKGLYYNIGAKKLDSKKAYPLHSDYFDPDESCIKTGILTEVMSVLAMLESENK